jgi:fructokinase
MNTLYGGIEAGGTKFICAVGTGPEDLSAVTSFPTTAPSETLARAIAFFREQAQTCSLAAIGIGAFGPVDPNPCSPTFGYITTTPKPGWGHTDFAGTIQRALGVPVGFDTDVNVAALGELQWGIAQGLDHFVYLTIGTGIGGGGWMNGRLMHGLLHPEMGHIRIAHDWERDPFPGICPYHGDCLEGLASGPAIERRWKQRGEDLSADHPAWELEAGYLAQAIVNVICILSPQRVVIGGGVLQQPRLLPLVRDRVQRLLNEYVKVPEILQHIDQYIVAPALGHQAGVLGAIAMARRTSPPTPSPGRRGCVQERG